MEGTTIQADISISERPRNTQTELQSPAERLLAVLGDADCRAILYETQKNALSEALGLPISTTYRKLDQLLVLGLLEERQRVEPSNKNSRSISVLLKISCCQSGARVIECHNLLRFSSQIWEVVLIDDVTDRCGTIFEITGRYYVPTGREAISRHNPIMRRRGNYREHVETVLAADGFPAVIANPDER